MHTTVVYQNTPPNVCSYTHLHDNNLMAHIFTVCDRYICVFLFSAHDTSILFRIKNDIAHQSNGSCIDAPIPQKKHHQLDRTAESFWDAKLNQIHES
jgi:hypothetical protein